MTNYHPTTPLFNESMLRVDYAGECGAVQIYRGQLAVLRRHNISPTLEHMLQQEEVHQQRFATLMQQRQVRPTLLAPLWHIMGYGIGAASALLGVPAAMALTVAVEEVIDDHYQDQLDTLADKDQELHALIKQCQAEEREHKEIGYQNDAEQAPAYPFLTAAIRTCTKLAIKLSKRL